jgi:hypothetical protein
MRRSRRDLVLFDPDRREALCDTAWDSSKAREAIRSIVHDIERSRVTTGYWPLHPLDNEGDGPRSGFKSLYLGSAGVLWSLWYVQREGAAELDSDPRDRSPEWDAMLIGAGHAICKAGPLSKGYGLCHGTSGNGYAFLKLYRRTRNSLWLERARSFAMHSMVQMGRMRERYGRGRYTLWAGDPGLAVYLFHCLDGTARLPTLDFIE